MLSVLKSKDPGVILICNTFANIIDVYNHSGEFKNAKTVESFATQLIKIGDIEENNVMEEMAHARLDTAMMTTW